MKVLLIRGGEVAMLRKVHAKAAYRRTATLARPSASRRLFATCVVAGQFCYKSFNELLTMGIKGSQGYI